MNWLSSIMKLLGGATFGRQLRKAIRITEEDPELQADLELLKKKHEEAEAKIKNFCKRRPDHELCQKKKPGKSRITKITW